MMIAKFDGIAAPKSARKGGLLRDRSLEFLSSVYHLTTVFPKINYQHLSKAKTLVCQTFSFEIAV